MPPLRTTGSVSVLRIEPLGTRVVLPAFVIGYEMSGDAETLVDDWDDAPSWLLTLDQQAGGYCMCYPSVVGSVLRFCDNGQHCRSDIHTVVRGFQAMAEDPKLGLLRRDYPMLAQLVYTHGDDYNSVQLQRLDRYLSQYFDIPSCASGVEAFVRLADCDPVTYFRGWNMLQAVTRTKPLPLYRNRKSISIDDSNIDSLDLTSGGTFGPDKLKVIGDFGKRIKMDALEVFLLWENSD